MSPDRPEGIDRPRREPAGRANDVDSIRIAVVQTRTHTDDPPKNVGRALAYVEQAAALGARIVCLPETYPGPWTPPMDYDAIPDLAAKARDLDMFVISGTIEPVPGDPTTYLNALVLTGPDGREAGRYRRTTPDGPWIYQGGSFWDFDYTAASELPVFDIGGCTIGMLVCSEVYVPELARQLALKGAEIIFMPHVTACLPSVMPGRGVVDRELWENRERDPVRLRQEFQGPKGRSWLMRWLPTRGSMRSRPWPLWRAPPAAQALPATAPRREWCGCPQASSPWGPTTHGACRTSGRPIAFGCTGSGSTSIWSPMRSSACSSRPPDT